MGTESVTVTIQFTKPQVYVVKWAMGGAVLDWDIDFLVQEREMDEDVAGDVLDVIESASLDSDKGAFAVRGTTEAVHYYLAELVESLTVLWPDLDDSMLEEAWARGMDDRPAGAFVRGRIRAGKNAAEKINKALGGSDG